MSIFGKLFIIFHEEQGYKNNLENFEGDFTKTKRLKPFLKKEKHLSQKKLTCTFWNRLLRFGIELIRFFFEAPIHFF